jgi:hypothetical protein
MKQYSVDAVPFKHADLDAWRDNFTGIAYHHEPTGLVVSGAVDDIWQQPDGKLIVVDYKATSKEGKIESLADSSWEDQYRRQIGVYQWLFAKNGFEVLPTGYFVYANGKFDADGFNDTLTFETTLVPCKGDSSWIEPTLHKIKECLDNETFPESGAKCEFCPYREASGKKLLALHTKKKK